MRISIIIFMLIFSSLVNAEPIPGTPIQFESVTYNIDGKQGVLFMAHEYPFADTCHKDFSYLQGGVFGFILDRKWNMDHYQMYKDKNRYHTHYYPIDGEKKIVLKPCNTYKENGNFSIQRRLQFKIDSNFFYTGGWKELYKIDKFVFKDEDLDAYRNKIADKTKCKDCNIVFSRVEYRVVFSNAHSRIAVLNFDSAEIPGD